MLKSIAESAYLLYMFHFCETSIDFGITQSPDGYWLKHVMGNSQALRICPFGRVAIFFLMGILLGRHFTPFITPRIVNISLGTSFLLSFMNTNALVYLMPIYIIEYVK